MAYLIKRYPNRKLYDVQASRYVTLDDLAALIRRGTEIAVTDAATGEDLTAVVLTQIILDRARGGQAGLPGDSRRLNAAAPLGRARAGDSTRPRPCPSNDWSIRGARMVRWKGSSDGPRGLACHAGRP